MTVPHHKVWAKCGHASDTKVIMVRDTGACIRGPVLFDVKYHVPQYSIRDARRGSSLTRWVRAFVWERRRRYGQSTTTVVGDLRFQLAAWTARHRQVHSCDHGCSPQSLVGRRTTAETT